MSATAALLCMAMAVYQEARSEPLAGQAAVAAVIMNRVRSQHFPNSVCGVVTQPAQFSFRWGPPSNEHAWLQAIMIADRTLAGDIVDPTHGALNYARAGANVDWTAGMTPVHIRGHHVFWRPGSTN